MKGMAENDTTPKKKNLSKMSAMLRLKIQFSFVINHKLFFRKILKINVLFYFYISDENFIKPNFVSMQRFKEIK